MKNKPTMSYAEAFNHLDNLLTYMKNNSFDEKQIMSVELAQSVLVNFELLNLITSEHDN